MLKKEFFIKAMKNGEYKRKAWVLSAFALTREGPDDWKKDAYPYRIVQTPTGIFYVNPENNNELSIIEDNILGTPLFHVKEKVIIGVKDEIVNFTSSDTETTYGRLLFNYIVLIHAFGNKINYINEKASADKIENIILPRLKDNPLEVSERNNDDIYIDEYLKFSDAMFYLAGFTQICVPAATYKTMTAPPGIIELKEKLLEENKDKLHDPAVIAKIAADLVAFDKEYMKGDLGEGFLITNKSYDVVRSKLFGMLGADAGLEDKVEVDLITNSLSQGWDINGFPAMMNSLRSKSYSRGTETMLGGEAFKWLQRASSNINVNVDDCGSKLGMDININETNLHAIIGFTIISNNNTIFIETEDMAKAYIGKLVTVRSPMFCKLDKTDFCKVCIGTNLANNPTSLSVAISGFGSALLSLFLARAHGQALVVAKMNYKEAIF